MLEKLVPVVEGKLPIHALLKLAVTAFRGFAPAQYLSSYHATFSTSHQVAECALSDHSRGMLLCLAHSTGINENACAQSSHLSSFVRVIACISSSASAVEGAMSCTSDGGMSSGNSGIGNHAVMDQVSSHRKLFMVSPVATPDQLSRTAL